MSLINVEALIAAEHPIRAIKRMCDEVLQAMDAHFDEIAAEVGAPSIPPETLLKAKVLQALYTVCSDRQLCARLQTICCSAGSSTCPWSRPSSTPRSSARTMSACSPTPWPTCSSPRSSSWPAPRAGSPTSTSAWASLKSFRPKDDQQGPGGGNAWMDFKGEQRRNDTHQSTTDAEAKLVREGPGEEARLCFAGHAAMEHRRGLCVHFDVKPAVGAPESAMAVEQMTELRNSGFRRRTVGGDKGYHTREFVEGARGQGIVPHPALKAGQKTWRVRLTAAHALSQKLRKRVEEIVGRTKTTGCLRKNRYRGVARTHAQGQYVVTACNLVRMAKLLRSGPPPPARA